MWRHGLLDRYGTRLFAALALSLLAHVVIVANLPMGLSVPAAKIEFHEMRIRVDLSDPKAPLAPEPQEPVETPQPAEPVVQALEAVPSAPKPTKQLLPVETLRTAWRSTDANTQPLLRLTDQPGLSTEARAYLASWQRDVQRVGRLNFPTDDHGNRIRGSLRLLVGIGPDGSLAYAKVTESSGKARLDAAAISIVELAAPFAPVPLSLRRGDAPLEIERNWRIGSSLVQL